jgi:hypothetical protein
MYLGQAHQDEFALRVLKNKRNGYFLEIGSNHPVHINNTYVFEKHFDWRGIMVEYDPSFLSLYKIHRPNSIHIIHDAATVDYKNVFEANNVPLSIDYLQIDLEAANGSTINTLERLNSDIFGTYKFAVVTFEHDVYCTNFMNTRIRSREIFKNKGYVCVFEDISDSGNPYEDWYVHPDLVDMNYVNSLIENNKQYYVNSSFTGKTIDWKNIKY